MKSMPVLALLLQAACAGKDDLESSTIGPPDSNPAYWATVDLGDRTTCAISSNQDVSCWDCIEELELCDPPAGPYAEVATDGSVACALSVEGEPVCWGLYWEEVVLPAGPLHGLAVGSGLACAFDGTERLICWGTDTDAASATPSGYFLQVSAGLGIYCAVGADTHLSCWGDPRIATATPTDDGYTQVSCGDYSCCAVKTDASYACWNDGSTIAGPLYRPEWSIAEIAVGGAYSAPYEYPSPTMLAITTDRKQVMFWDDDEVVVEPVFFDAPEGQEWAQISVGDTETCALTSAGELDDRFPCAEDAPSPR